MAFCNTFVCIFSVLSRKKRPSKETNIDDIFDDKYNGVYIVVMVTHHLHGSQISKV